MSCNGVNYAAGRLSGNNTRFRILPLAIGQREVAAMTLTTGAAISEGDETLTLSTGLVKPVWAGDVLIFNKGTANEIKVVLAESVAVGETTLQIVPAVDAIASGSTAQTIGSIYVAGITALQIGSQPNTIQSQDLLSNGFTETTITGDTISFPLTLDRVKNCPGQGVLASLAYDPKVRGREVWAQVLFEDGGDSAGETYEGAFVVTSTNQNANPSQNRTMDLTLTSQGCSFKFTHAAGFDPVEFPQA